MLPRYTGIKQARFVKRQRSKKCRHTINQLVRKYCKDKKYRTQDHELHLPQVKDLYDNWYWD